MLSIESLIENIISFVKRYLYTCYVSILRPRLLTWSISEGDLTKYMNPNTFFILNMLTSAVALYKFDLASYYRQSLYDFYEAYSREDFFADVYFGNASRSDLIEGSSTLEFAQYITDISFFESLLYTVPISLVLYAIFHALSFLLFGKNPTAGIFRHLLLYQYSAAILFYRLALLILFMDSGGGFFKDFGLSMTVWHAPLVFVIAFLFALPIIGITKIHNPLSITTAKFVVASVIVATSSLSFIVVSDFFVNNLKPAREVYIATGQDWDPRTILLDSVGYDNGKVKLRLQGYFVNYSKRDIYLNDFPVMTSFQLDTGTVKATYLNTVVEYHTAYPSENNDSMFVAKAGDVSFVRLFGEVDPEQFKDITRWIKEKRRFFFNCLPMSDNKVLFYSQKFSTVRTNWIKRNE